MPKQRLLWLFYRSYFTLVFIIVLGLGWIALYGFEQLLVSRMDDELESHARFVEQSFGSDAFSTNPVELSLVCKRLADATDSRITVVLPSGEVLCDSEKRAADVDQQPLRPEIQAALAGETNRGERVLPGASQKIGYVILPVWRDGRVAAAVQVSASTVPVEQALTLLVKRLALGGLFAMLVAAALGYYVARRLSRPIAEMRIACSRFAQGGLDERLATPDIAELALLANTLNSMAKKLRIQIAELVRQNHQQNAVLTSMVEGVLAVDNRQRIISLNKATAELLGIDEEHARGRSLQEVIRNTDLRRFITRALARKEPIDDDVVVHGSNESVLQARGGALHDAEGRAIGAVVVLDDVTEFRRLEDIRRDFVANVSHELKTPVTSIKGFVETLLDGAMHNPSDTERFLTIVAKQADRLSAIIDDLLSLSKIEQEEEAADIQLERRALKEVLESAIHNCEAKAAERQIELSLNCPAEIHVDVNSQLLEQAVINLLENAIKYSEPGKQVQVQGYPSGNDAMVAVIDHGVGIAAEHLSRVFERFYRVDKARSRKLGGTGLGLAIVKHIVRAHQGRVAVKSTLGVGSTFTITLPLHKDSASDDPARDLPAAAAIAPRDAASL